MQRILYYFRMTGIKCNFIEKTNKLGLNKNNNIYNRIVEIKRYILIICGVEYIFEYKISGRPQYILLDRKEILINVRSSLSFIENMEKLFSLKKIKKNLQREKLKGETIRKLRRSLKLTPQKLGSIIGKSGLTIIRYEAGSLFLSLNDIAVIIHFTSSLSIFLNIIDQLQVEDKERVFEIEKLKDILKKSEEIKMTDFLTAEEVAELCKIKTTKAYRLMKEVNEEMKEKGYLTIRGRVNRKFLYLRLGLEEGKKQCQ